jgi:hypothetical protein
MINERRFNRETEERSITIDEVNVNERYILGHDEWNTIIRLSLHFIDPVVSIPKVGEQWSVHRKGANWFLGRNGNAATIAGLEPGDKKIEASENLYLVATEIYLNGVAMDGLGVIDPDTITAVEIAPNTITHTEIASANKDGLTSTPSLRTLGTGAQQAAAGSHGSQHADGGADPLPNGAITEDMLASAAVTPAKADLLGGTWNITELQRASMSVHRHPYGGDRHIERGTVTVPFPPGTADVTFTNPFSANPVITLGPHSASNNGFGVLSRSGTGFTIGHDSGSSLDFDWIAEGPD